MENPYNSARKGKHTRSPQKSLNADFLDWSENSAKEKTLIDIVCMFFPIRDHCKFWRGIIMMDV